MQSTREAIREFITTNFYVADPASLDDGDSLLDGGIVDSTGVLELVAFLEERFGIRVEDRDIVPENLDSIEALEAFVVRALGPARGAA
jgi:acyl carrier protein